jgi:hypothetical protein
MADESGTRAAPSEKARPTAPDTNSAAIPSPDSPKPHGDPFGGVKTPTPSGDTAVAQDSAKRQGDPFAHKLGSDPER